MPNCAGSRITHHASYDEAPFVGDDDLYGFIGLGGSSVQGLPTNRSAPACPCRACPPNELGAICPARSLAGSIDYVLYYVLPLASCHWTPDTGPGLLTTVFIRFSASQCRSNANYHSPDNNMVDRQSRRPMVINRACALVRRSTSLRTRGRLRSCSSNNQQAND